MIIRETRVTHALSRSGLPDLDYALNPYIGCLHGCIYCYARLYTSMRDAAENWGKIVYVKANLIDALRRDVRRLRPGVVGIGTITDPYQPPEALYRLTRRALKILLDNGFHASIQTKNTLILRDLDILRHYRRLVDVGFTITTLDYSVSQRLEPGASPPKARAEAIRRLSSEGIDTWIFYGPVIPGLNDDEDTVDSIISLAAEADSRILVDSLHIKSFMLKPRHPLYPHVLLAKQYDWSRFYHRFLEKCGEKGVKCTVGLAEPPKTSIITLDKFMEE
jgi:DNA repair photolyase